MFNVECEDEKLKIAVYKYLQDVVLAGYAVIVSRGSSWVIDVDEFINHNQEEQALHLVDSLIKVKSQDLPRFAYFDRFLTEDKRIDVANARADVYELQWKRIEILNATNQKDVLRDALEDYVDVIGYNQEDAEALLKQINSK